MSADSAVPASDPVRENGDSATAALGFHYSRVSEESFAIAHVPHFVLQEELVRISKLPASNVRPAFLKAECNNE